MNQIEIERVSEFQNGRLETHLESSTNIYYATKCQNFAGIAHKLEISSIPVYNEDSVIHHGGVNFT